MAQIISIERISVLDTTKGYKIPAQITTVIDSTGTKKMYLKYL